MAFNPVPEPVAVAVAAENCVVLGEGVPSTENVNPSRFGFPVPATVYKEPTMGTKPPCATNVKVTTSPEMVYAVTCKGAAVLPVEEAKLGGAPGPT